MTFTHSRRTFMSVFTSLAGSPQCRQEKRPHKRLQRRPTWDGSTHIGAGTSRSTTTGRPTWVRIRFRRCASRAISQQRPRHVSARVSRCQDGCRRLGTRVSSQRIGRSLEESPRWASGSRSSTPPRSSPPCGTSTWTEANSASRRCRHAARCSGSARSGAGLLGRAFCRKHRAPGCRGARGPDRRTESGGTHRPVAHAGARGGAGPRLRYVRP